jgi:hypothetical protein
MEQGPARVRETDAGVVVLGVIGVVLCAFALTVDFPKAAFGFQSDEATYYTLAHSLARDGNFAYERRDLVRVWEEFPTGPEGIFLKPGRHVSLTVTSAFPFLGLRYSPDSRTDRLYFAKSFTYPLAAAPFVWVFGTNGFLLLHALLLTLVLALAYAFLRARSGPSPALAWAIAFFAASAAPVYFVWLTPELFNLSLTMCGLFLWAYKEVAPPREGPSGFLRSPGSTIAGAVLIGVATFSKPTNLPVILPVLGLLLARRQWRHLIVTGTVFGTVVAALFAINLLITGDFNYQGGERNTFYGQLGAGFPFQTPQSTFASGGLPRSTNAVPTEVLFNRNALLEVLPRNVIWFTLGRHTGLVPYFFPGIVALAAFAVAWRTRPLYQWLVAGAFASAGLALIAYMPFTYSGGGGPVGNRYFLGLYPLLFFVLPQPASLRSAALAVGVGALFTAQLVLNPFYTSFHPAEHVKRGPFRLLPVELSLLNDLPMNVTPRKVRQPLAGTPPVLAYFLDDNAYDREGEWFWVRGQSRADLILRAPVRQREDGSYEPLRIKHVILELRAGDVATEVTVKSASRTSRASLAANASGGITTRLGDGLPYKPFPDLPTNYVYRLSIASSAGFTPLFTSGSRDNRYLGAYVRISPVYE